MKFLKLNATFGKLQKQTLELSEGFNIIEGPNEAGKSTWADFLRAMLYGIDTRQRDKKGSIAEKNRYQPWEGGTMEGSAEITWKGKQITLRRTTPRPNAPMGKFEAVYTGTEEPVSKLTGETAGEILTGVGREVYERSAFVGQCSLPVDSSPELERRVAAILTSGQEDVSYSIAEKRLREWRNRRQSNLKRGIIPKLEQERDQVRATLDQLEGAACRASAARAEIAVLEGERTALEEQAKACTLAEGAAQRARYDAAKAELEQAQQALQSIQAERAKHGTPPDEAALRTAQGELSYLNTLQANIKQAEREAQAGGLPAVTVEHPVFGGMDPETAKAKAQEDAEQARSHREELTNRPIRVRVAAVAILLFTLAGVLINNYLLGSNQIVYIALGVIAVVGLLAVGITHYINSWRRTLRVFKMLDSYGVREGQEILDQAKDYIARWEQADVERTEFVVRAVARERLEAEREELTQRLLEQARTFAPEVTDLYGVSTAISRALKLQEMERTAALRLESAQKVFDAVSAQGTPPEQGQAPAQLPEQSAGEIQNSLDGVRSQLERLNRELAMAQGEMNSLGDPAVLQARLGELEGELERRREEYEALNLAIEVLGEANAQLRQRFSPALNARAGGILSALTGGKYSKVALTREFEALVSQADDPTPHKALNLSQGTIDQVYLAVRLAVCREALPAKEPPPLILDDALVNFDDDRMKLALNYLRMVAKDRQVILFTCHSRERECLEKADGVNFIRLQS